MGYKREVKMAWGKLPPDAPVLKMDIYEPPRVEPTSETKDDLALKPTQSLDHDVVFGELTEEGPNYRNVHTDRNE